MSSAEVAARSNARMSRMTDDEVRSLAAALDAAWAAWDAAWAAVTAAVARDLITPEQHNLLMGPWREVMGEDES